MGLIIFILVLSILIIVHEFGHFFMAKKMGVKVEEFSLGFGPKLFSKKINDTQYSICAVIFGGYVKSAGDNLEEFKHQPYEYLSKTPGQRARIVFFGPFLNYIMAFFCFWMIFFLGYPIPSTKVGGITDGFGAQAAGLRQGDVITEIDGSAVEYWDQLQKLIYPKKEGERVEVNLLREGRQYRIDVEIKEIESAEDLLGLGRGRLGIASSDEILIKREGIVKSFFSGINRLTSLTFITYKAIFRMLTGKLSLKDSVTGPLGIFYITSHAARLGFVAILHLMGVLNVSLAIFNLMPIPVLDGGHMLLLGIEKLKGDYLSPRVDKVVNQLGLSLILLLAGFIFYNDLVKFGIWEKVAGLFSQ
jgi:regulator of sigma E protease